MLSRLQKELINLERVAAMTSEQEANREIPDTIIIIIWMRVETMCQILYNVLQLFYSLKKKPYRMSVILL